MIVRELLPGDVIVRDGLTERIESVLRETPKTRTFRVTGRCGLTGRTGQYTVRLRILSDFDLAEDSPLRG